MNLSPRPAATARCAAGLGHPDRFALLPPLSHRVV